MAAARLQLVHFANKLSLHTYFVNKSEFNVADSPTPLLKYSDVPTKMTSTGASDVKFRDLVSVSRPIWNSLGLDLGLE